MSSTTICRASGEGSVLYSHGIRIPFLPGFSCNRPVDLLVRRASARGPGQAAADRGVVHLLRLLDSGIPDSANRFDPVQPRYRASRAAAAGIQYKARADGARHRAQPRADRVLQIRGISGRIGQLDLRYRFYRSGNCTAHRHFVFYLPANQPAGRCAQGAGRKITFLGSCAVHQFLPAADSRTDRAPARYAAAASGTTKLAAAGRLSGHRSGAVCFRPVQENGVDRSGRALSRPCLPGSGIG